MKTIEETKKSQEIQCRNNEEHTNSNIEKRRKVGYILSWVIATLFLAIIPIYFCFDIETAWINVVAFIIAFIFELLMLGYGGSQRISVYRENYAYIPIMCTIADIAIILFFNPFEHEMWSIARITLASGLCMWVNTHITIMYRSAFVLVDKMISPNKYIYFTTRIINKWIQRTWYFISFYNRKMDIESTNIMTLAKSMNTSECDAYYSVNIGDIIRLKTKDFIMNKDECSIEDIELENNYTVATDSDFLNEIGINDFDVQEKYEKNRHNLYALMGSVSMFAYTAVGVIKGEHMLQQSTIEFLTSERIWAPVLVIIAVALSLIFINLNISKQKQKGMEKQARHLKYMCTLDFSIYLFSTLSVLTLIATIFC